MTRRRRVARALGLVGAALAALAAPARGQQRPQPPRPAPPTTARDTIRRPATGRPLTPQDSAARDSVVRDSIRRNLVQWAETDSVIDELLSRQGYTVTRYQGRRVIFDAQPRRVLRLERDSSARAAVGRDQTLIVSDTIIYDDSIRVIRAYGRENVIRDPSRNDDVISNGSLTYNLRDRTAQVGAVRTTIESGQKYYVQAERGAFADDSTGEEAEFFGRSGSLTTCEDSLPHYRFQSRELKLIRGRIAVGRPAVLYIYDVPVFWLPFIFQDIRSGRRSGMLTPRFGFSDIVRQNRTYRRNIENLGYYFNFSDYQDLSVWLDWRSGASPPQGTPGAGGGGFIPFDPGFVRFSGEWRYRWLNRFLGGRIGVSQTRIFNGDEQLTVAWTHQQEFSKRTRLTADVNFTNNTQVQRQVGFNAAQVLGTIRSSLNFQTQRGPFSISAGGNRTQYPGRPQVDQTLPTLSISSRPLTIGGFATWTPALSASETRTTDQPTNGQNSFLFSPRAGGGVDSIPVPQNRRGTSLSFDTPITFGRVSENGTPSGFAVSFRNSFRLQDDANTFLQQRAVEEVVPNAAGGLDTVSTTRFFNGFTQTTLDWQTALEIPAAFGRGTWNITPSVQFVNTDPNAFFVRSTFSGGRWVAQSKRPQFSISASPTFFGFFRGVGPIQRVRHQLSPNISWAVAPRGDVSDEYLSAIGQARRGYLGAQPQNVISLGLQQNFEVKLRPSADSADIPGAGRKVRALTIQTDPLSYDFIRLRTIRQRSANPSQVSAVQGLTTDRWGLGLRSDFLPGFDFGMRWSLFLGSTVSDTAEFRPYREEMRMSLNLDRQTGVIDWLVRKLGGGKFTPAQSNLTASDSMQLRNNQNQGMFGQPLGQQAQIRPATSVIPSGQGWRVSLNYTENRQRPPRGTNFLVVRPEDRCEPLRLFNPIQYQQCLVTGSVLPGIDPNAGQIGLGAPIIVNPPLRTMAVSTNFNLTPKWAASWTTSYDITRSQFAAQQVSLQRELHDWRLSMNFTQAPNGNFLFSFFIALKAQPDIRLPYDQQTFRRPDAGR
ncbi:MAG: hypothetical protein MUF21_04035 [Gemmatimonadaceae bacterium]|nr:hypothetical protein [Gemmatimonadaceae bacterium]